MNRVARPLQVGGRTVAHDQVVSDEVVDQFSRMGREIESDLDRKTAMVLYDRLEAVARATRTDN